MTLRQHSFTRTLSTVSIAGLLVWSCSVAYADDPDETFTGAFRIGYRSVDVGGSETKYREDLNYDDGPRLFDFRLDFEPRKGTFADLVTLDVSNFGGDPFETLHFALRKYGKLDLSYSRTKSDFFYEDTILPLELSDPSLSNGGDFHTFDFDRVRDRANFGFRFSPRAKLDVGFERFTKQGESTTTLDIQRDEFEVDKPIDESYDNLRVGFEYAWKKTTLIIEEQVREYENNVEIFLPGQSAGENPTNATSLNFFFLDQPYSYDSVQHSMRVNTRPNKNLIVTVAAVIQSLALDVEAAESSDGIDFRGAPFATDLSGAGDIDRDTVMFDFDLSYLINDRVALIAGAYSRQLDQEGRFVFGNDRNLGDWEIDTLGGEVGVEVSVSRDVTLAAGVSIESRDVEHDASDSGGPLVPNETGTDRDGIFARLAWRPGERFHLEASYETGSIDDPFTLASPTDRNRLRLNAAYKRENGFYAQGTFIAQSLENDNSGWEADRDQVTVRVGFQRSGFDLGAGYTTYDVERDADRTITTLPGFGGGVSFPFPILFAAESDFLDARLRWQANERITLGTDLRRYENAGNFGLERDDLRAFAEVMVFEDYSVHLSYRTIDYDEDAADFDDYDAEIIELSVGYRW